jgi:hypothetical protein
MLRDYARTGCLCQSRSRKSGSWRSPPDGCARRAAENAGDATAGYTRRRWSAYLDEDKANGLCDSVTAEEVAVLYQEAGNFAFDDPTPGEVRAFFSERVLTLLMR